MLKRLGDAYRIALKRNPLSANGKLEEYNAAREALDEEKAALLDNPTTSRSTRLSVKKSEMNIHFIRMMGDK